MLPSVERTAPQMPDASTGALLEVTGLRVTYGGVVAVDGVDLNVPEKRLVGLVGPDGD